MDYLSAAAGLVILLVSGDMLVRSAVAWSLHLGIPTLIVSLTIVAFGTSAPELLIAIEAAITGASGIILGNVVGSNIANVLLVLAAPALIAPLCNKGSSSQRMLLVMLAISVLFVGMCFTGVLDWRHGAVLIALQVYVLYDAYRNARRTGDDGADEIAELGDVAVAGGMRKPTIMLIAALIGLPVGAHLLIEGARSIAASAGLSEAAIGLSLVAIGTSLPELATTVSAALRRQTDVAMGNIIGSNIFNILSVAGVAALVSPLTVADEFLQLDLWVMLGAALVLTPFVILRWPLGRVAGVLMLVAYIIFVYIVLTPRM